VLLGAEAGRAFERRHAVRLAGTSPPSPQEAAQQLFEVAPRVQHRDDSDDIAVEPVDQPPRARHEFAILDDSLPSQFGNHPSAARHHGERRRALQEPLRNGLGPRGAAPFRDVVRDFGQIRDGDRRPLDAEAVSRAAA